MRPSHLSSRAMELPSSFYLPSIVLSRRELRHYRRIIGALPVVRREKVLAFRAVINNGTYYVDPHLIAEKMVEEGLFYHPIGA